MEKWIYLNVVKLGEYEKDYMRMMKEARNEWYVIKPKAEAEGKKGEVEITIRRVFEEAESFNHPNPALYDTICEAIGSCIYVMGGRCVACQADRGCDYQESDKIRCIDTQNPNQGWQTCFSLPIKGRVGRSAVVDDKWLLLFTAPRQRRLVDPNYPSFAFDVTAAKPFKSIPVPQPGGASRVSCPFVSSCISPGVLASYMNGSIYTLDFNHKNIGSNGNGNGSEWKWNLHGHGVPFHPMELTTFYSAVGDGMFYLFHCFHHKLICYDLRENRQRYAVTLPESFWLALRGPITQIIVLSEDNFCMLSNLFDAPHSLRIYFTRFSVRYHSPQSQSEPYVDVQETQCFPIAGRRIENYVAVDAPADVAKSRVDMASGVEADVLKELKENK